MRKFIIALCLLFIGVTMFSQEDTTLINKTKEVVSEYVDVDSALSKVNEVEELFVHYFKEAAEGSKALVGSTLEVAEKAVTLLLEQSTIIVRQFIIYTSITHAIPIIIGLLLVFWLPKKITKKFSTNFQLAEAYNLQIDKDNAETKEDIKDKNIYDLVNSQKTKKILSSGEYYDNYLTLVSANIGTYLGYIGGAYLVALNIMPFIKVTFFSKLYLVELLLKYV